MIACLLLYSTAFWFVNAVQCPLLFFTDYLSRQINSQCVVSNGHVSDYIINLYLRKNSKERLQ